MAEHNVFGNMGEDLAARYLEQQGFTILVRNWKNRGRKEIDIIAVEGDDIVFVEVKTRAENSLATPFQAVDGRKQHRLALAANSFILSNRVSLNPRFDVVGIIGSGQSARIEHIRGAFVPSAIYY